jgi:hypothetical protein
MFDEAIEIRAHLQRMTREELVELALPTLQSKFASGEFIAAVLGTRRWCVAPRLGSKMAERYDVAISQKRYNSLNAMARCGYDPVAVRYELGI